SSFSSTYLLARTPDLAKVAAEQVKLMDWSFTAYAICFGVGLLFTLISAVAGHLFGGHDAHGDIGTGGHAEAGYEHTGMPGVAPFSPTTIASFITAFGGFGLIFSRLHATKSPWVSA